MYACDIVPTTNLPPSQFVNLSVKKAKTGSKTKVKHEEPPQLEASKSTEQSIHNYKMLMKLEQI